MTHAKIIQDQTKEHKVSRIEEAIKTILSEIDPDPNREGLKETPNRVARFYKEFFEEGLSEPNFEVKQFNNSYGDQLISLTNIHFTSFCEHHLLPFSGEMHLAYLPNKKVVGLSKLARIVDYFSKRLQLQEKLTHQVVKFLEEKLTPKGVMAVTLAKHSCVSCRGIEKNGAVMKTVLKTGAFYSEQKNADEFMDAIQLNMANK